MVGSKGSSGLTRPMPSFQQSINVSLLRPTCFAFASHPILAASFSSVKSISLWIIEKKIFREGRKPIDACWRRCRIKYMLVENIDMRYTSQDPVRCLFVEIIVRRVELGVPIQHQFMPGLCENFLKLIKPGVFQIGQIELILRKLRRCL